MGKGGHGSTITFHQCIHIPSTHPAPSTHSPRILFPPHRLLSPQLFLSAGVVRLLFRLINAQQLGRVRTVIISSNYIDPTDSHLSNSFNKVLSHLSM